MAPVGHGFYRKSPIEPRTLYNPATAAFISGLVLAAAPVYADTATNACRFNGQWEQCVIAGGLSSFTVTYARDSKKINIEKVGAAYPCSDGTANECGKVLITEPRERRTTWGMYRVAGSGRTMTVRSARGNIYQFQF